MGQKPKYVEEAGVSHADELLYLFNIRLPLVLCDLEPLMGL